MIRLPPILFAAVASCASLIFIGQSQCDAFTSPSSPSPSLKGTAKISPILSSSGRLRSANSIENVRKSSSNLHLFDSLLQPKKPNGGLSDKIKDTQKMQRLKSNRIPEEELKKMNDGFGVSTNGNDFESIISPPFPYTIDLLPTKSTNKVILPNTPVKASRLVIRHLEEEDIPKVLPEIVREFGSLISPSNEPKQPGDEVATQIENYLFSLTVLIGLTQRVERRKKGYLDDASGNSSLVIPDHNVICIVEQIPFVSENSSTTSYRDQIVGIGELSWQPPDPNRNAPPFVLPYFVKSILSRFNPVPAISAINGDNASSSKELINEPMGYISNVLVYKSRRGLGYGRVLMAALEGIARLWSCADVRLHVDANDVSGKVAQELYWSLGYQGVPDSRENKKRGSGLLSVLGKGREQNRVGFEWMGPNMANQGLYMVDGIPLLYLCKNLKG
mmetsp:Transcript_19460/g.40774  ORF Transcript_19460/g.40774 Transcript_19460/m.40774 type:complete len:446 (-) Transcript_19460:27-1364(-)